MDEAAEGGGIQREGPLVRVGRPPAEAVLPHEAERVAQERLQRARRVLPRQRGLQHRMVGPHEAVVGGDLRAAPVAPAGVGGGRARARGELVRARHQAVGLRQGVFGHAGAMEHPHRHLRQQRGDAEQPARGIAAAVGAGHARLGREQDVGEAGPVVVRDGARLQLGPRHDVVGQQGILAGAPRPGAAVEPEQPHVGPRGRGERRGVHPGDRCRGLDAVRHAEVGERRLEGRRRRPHQGAAPDQPGRAAQQGFPDLPRRIEAAGDEVDGEQDGGDDVRRGLVGREPLPPSLRRVEDEAAGQVPAPALRQGAEGRAVSGDGPGEAQHAIAIEPLQQQVGQGRAGLAVAGRQGAPAVREMHVDVRLGRERQHEVVVVARRRGRDGDVARRDAAGEMAAGPAEGLHHLVTRAGAARDRHLGPCGSGGLDRHRGGPDPVGHGTGPRRPTGRDGPGDRHDEGAPAGIDLRHGAELHLAQHPGGVAQPLDRPGDEVGRPAHARREAIQRGRFDARQGRQALIAGRLGRATRGRCRPTMPSPGSR